jgi:hypothetical protein
MLNWLHTVVIQLVSNKFGFYHRLVSISGFLEVKLSSDCGDIFNGIKKVVTFSSLEHPAIKLEKELL